MVFHQKKLCDYLNTLIIWADIFKPNMNIELHTLFILKTKPEMNILYWAWHF